MIAFILRAEPGTIDHKDGNGLNNRRNNLRRATANQQAWNTRKRNQKTTSKYKGVSRSISGKFQAKICFNYKQIHLGYFVDEEDAARAYDEAARELHGEFARLNFEN